jgi:hypothetical protein
MSLLAFGPNRERAQLHRLFSIDRHVPARVDVAYIVGDWQAGSERAAVA